jgi:hypothetical protein
MPNGYYTDAHCRVISDRPIPGGHFVEEPPDGHGVLIPLTPEQFQLEAEVISECDHDVRRLRAERAAFRMLSSLGYEEGAKILQDAIKGLRDE